VTTSGTFTEHALSDAADAVPWGLTTGPDGNLWFAELEGGRIGSITTAGVVNTVALPTAGARPVELAAGPDGNIWFTESGADSIGTSTV
jgi:virginiamycin B lyase